MNLRKDHYSILLPALNCAAKNLTHSDFLFFENITLVWRKLGQRFIKLQYFYWIVILTIVNLLIKFKNLQNFQQRISWFSHRWRTQRIAIRNMNCRFSWIIESLNAHCALWYSRGHACLSVISLSNLWIWYWVILLVGLGVCLKSIGKSGTEKC